MEITPEKINQYASINSSAEDEILTAISEEIYRHQNWPAMHVGHVEGLFLKTLVQISKAKNILEIGTFAGYSALAMAMGLPDNGQLTTLDTSEETTAVAQKFWQKSPHGKKIKLLIGEALETLKSLPGPYDLVFIDADKKNYLNYFNEVLPKVKSGGLIIADNTLWRGEVLVPDKGTAEMMDYFNKTVVQNKNTEAVILPIRDGITLIRKK